MIWKVIRQSLKQSVHEYIIYFFTLAVGVTAFYSYAVLIDERFRSDMGLSTSFSVLSDKMLYASPFIFLMPTILIIYIERFLYIRKQKELAIFILSGLRQSKAACLYCIERMVVAFAGVSVGIVSGGMVSSVILRRYLTYMGENLTIKPLFYPFTIFLAYGYFILIFAVLSIYYSRKIVKSVIVDLFRTTEDNTSDQHVGRGNRIFALAVCYAGFIYISGIMICIMSVCFGYFPIIYKMISLGSVLISILLLGIFVISKNVSRSIIAAICLGVVEDGMLCVLYPALNSLTKGKLLNPQLCRLLVYGMIYMLFSIVFLFYEVFSEILLDRRCRYNKEFSENRIILGDICSNIHIYGKVVASITLILIFIIVLGIWSPIYLERIEGYLQERSIFDMQLFTTVSYDKYRNHESSESINYGLVAARLEEEDIVIDNEIIMETFFVEEQTKEGEGGRLATCVPLTDYNKLLISLGQEPIVLTGEYAIQWDQQYSEEQMKEALHDVSSVIAGDTVLWDVNAPNYMYETGMALFTNHMQYVYIVPDDLCEKLNCATSIALYHFGVEASYETALQIEREMNGLFAATEDKVYVRLKTLQETETVSVITLIRMVTGYMETALILGCLAMLSVQQFTDILQSGRKYKVLYFLGFRKSQIKKLVLKNEMAWFLMPIASAEVLAMGGVIFSFTFFLEEFLFYSTKNQILMYIVETYTKLAVFSSLYIITTWLAARKFIDTSRTF